MPGHTPKEKAKKSGIGTGVRNVRTLKGKQGRRGRSRPAFGQTVRKTAQRR